LVDRDITKRNYIDYAKDPLDKTLVNAQLEILQSELIVLKCIKDITAGNEILISFGLASWAFYFVDYWKYNEEQMKKFENIYLLTKKVKEVYSIKDEFTTTIYNNNYICKTIASKLDEFENWQIGINYHLTHFIQTRGSSYINAFYQCLSHIPALTRLILETDIFENMLDKKNDKNQLSQYIIQLKLNDNINMMEYKGDSYLSVFDPQQEDIISHDQNFSNQFARDIIDEEFGKCSPIYDIVKRHLFGFYVNKIEYCMEDSKHCFSYRSIINNEGVKVLRFGKPGSNEVENLNDLFLKSTEFEEINDNYQCPFCVKQGKSTIKYNWHTYPRVLLFELERRVFDNEGETTSFIDKDIIYPRYLKVKGKVQYQLIGAVVYKDNAFISYFLHSNFMWYKDNGTIIIMVSAEEACNQPIAYFFIYK